MSWNLSGASQFLQNPIMEESFLGNQFNWLIIDPIDPSATCNGIFLGPRGPLRAPLSVVRNKKSLFFSAIFFSPPIIATQHLPLMIMVDIFMSRTLLAQFGLVSSPIWQGTWFLVSLSWSSWSKGDNGRAIKRLWIKKPTMEECNGTGSQKIKPECQMKNFKIWI